MASEAGLATGMSQNMRSALFMMLSMAGFAFNDAFLKSVSGGLPLFQAVFLRGIIATLLIGGLAWMRGGLWFRPGARDARLIALRCGAEVGGTVCFLTALFNMPIANASAILQSVPLAVTLGAALFLREPVGWRRYLAIGIGFFGVLIIVRPGSDGFNLYALWAMGAIGFIVIRDLSTRRMSGSVPVLGLVFLTALVITASAGLLSLFAPWRTVAPGHAAALGISAVCLLVGYLFGIKTMRLGEIGFVQPFRYTILIWSILLGIVMFGEWPDAWMLTGSAIIVATGLYALYRERSLGLPPRPAAPLAASAGAGR